VAEITPTKRHAAGEERVISVLAYSALSVLVLHYLVTGRWWVWNVVSVVPPIVFLAAPVILALWAAVRRLWRATIVLVLAAAVGWTQADIHLRVLRPHSTPAAAHTVAVVDWNTRFWNEEHDPDFYTFLRRQDADIYQLQEYWDRDGAPLDREAEIRAAFPGYTLVTSGDLVTLSRLPVVAHRSGAAGHSQRVDVDTGASTVSFYNVHITMQLGHDMRRIFERRQEEFAALEEDVASNSLPVFISGDFNSTSSMGVLRWLQARFQDSADAGGTLLPRTWAFHLLPSVRLWRLDFAFVDRRLAVLQHTNMPGAGSDHWAQQVTIGF
jgi:endonuclease/exonuclease/phosphatase (EEP) superfamily protein YafD